MGNTKSLVFVIISLIFLISGALCSQLLVQPVFALLPDPCFGKHSAGCPGMRCTNDPANLSAYCCWTDIHDGQQVCQGCNVNTDTGEFENCTDVFPTSKGTLGTGVIAPPPSGIAPPPQTGTCPENTVLDAQGNCSPLTQGPQETAPSPEEIAPTIDCAQNPDDPLCETARIPEAVEQPEEQESSENGDDSSGDGGNENNDNSE